MEKCLVTKHIGKVNNNELPILGKFIVHVSKVGNPTQYTNVLYLSFNKTSKISTVNNEDNLTLDSNMSSGWTNSIVIPANTITGIYCKNGDYDLIVDGKYSIVNYGAYVANINSEAFSVDASQFKYSNYLKYCIYGYGNVKADISDFYNKELIYLSIKELNYNSTLKDLNNISFKEGGDPNCILLGNSGKILSDSLSELNVIPRVKSINFLRHKITGTLQELMQKFPDVTNINIANTSIRGDISNITNPVNSITVYNTDITGSLESFVATQRAQGREEGSCSNGGWWGSNITFDGSTISVDSKNNTVKWTSNTITVGDKTINA